MYLCIDLKSFYASVECVCRGLDPMQTLLVVADAERTDKTICLAVTPALKALGVKNRCRLFEVPKHLDVIVAPPRMHLYMEFSAKVYSVYLKYISADDIHVYSCDEAFLDIEAYLNLYKTTPLGLAKTIIADILKTTGITATCGIGTNLYLAKVALDIIAKHAKDYIGFLDEERYRELLWDHLPLTDFWQVGPGTVRRLRAYGIYTMRQVALSDEYLIYKIFGKDGEFLIDHSWGRETATIADIKRYRPASQSLSTGQVLPRCYGKEEGLLLAKEMADVLCLDLVKKELVASHMTLWIGVKTAADLEILRGTERFIRPTNSAKQIMDATQKLYFKVMTSTAPIKRIGISFHDLEAENLLQFSLFEDVTELARERSRQEAVINIKTRFGKNAIFKGMNLEEGARTLERNAQIGGHRA